MRLNPRENSSDLDRARELARRLREGGPVAPSAAPPVPFVRFGLKPPAAARPTAALSEPLIAAASAASAAVHSPLADLVGESEPLESLPPAPVRSWSEVLDRCLLLADAAAAMIVDATGLMIASAGDWEGRSPEQIEALGARLQVAVEQSRHLEEPCRVVAMALQHGWLSGIRVETGAGAMALGFLAPLPSDGAAGARAAAEIASFLATSIEA